MMIERTDGNRAEGHVSNALRSLSGQDFLRLLTTQLRYQDPLSPLDVEGFTGQLAQLSAVESLRDLGDQLSSLRSYGASIDGLLATSLLGARVTVRGERLQLAGQGAGATLSYELADDAAAVTLYLYDAEGNLVRRLELGAQRRGRHEVVWDGRDQRGDPLPAGPYALRVEARDEGGGAVDVVAQREGTVRAVSLEEGGVCLELEDGTRVSLRDLVSVSR